MRIAWTRHAASRIRKRRIEKEEVVEGITHPDATLKKHGKYYYQKTVERGKIEIVCIRTESIIKILTVYWI